MSPAGSVVAAIAIYVTAISAGIALYLVFRDSLEDLSSKFRWALAVGWRTIGTKNALLVRFVGRSFRSAGAGRGAELWRQRLVLRARLARLQCSCQSARVSFRPELDRRWLLLCGRLARIHRLCTATLAGCVVGLRRGGVLLSARLMRLRRTGESAVAELEAELRRQRLLSRARLARLRCSCHSARVGLRLELDRRWLLLCRLCAATRAGCVVGLRRGGALLAARVMRLRRTGESAVAELAARCCSRARAVARGVVVVPRVTIAARLPLRRRPIGAFAGALAAITLAAVATTAVVATHDFGPSATIGGRASSGPRSEALRPPRSSSTRVVAASDRPPPPLRITGPTAAPAIRMRSTPAPHATIVSNDLQMVSAHTPPTAGATFATTAPQSHGPAPLPAPAGSSPPSPLRAP
jgi:hypothetical protein